MDGAKLHALHGVGTGSRESAQAWWGAMGRMLKEVDLLATFPIQAPWLRGRSGAPIPHDRHGQHWHQPSSRAVEPGQAHRPEGAVQAQGDLSATWSPCRWRVGCERSPGSTWASTASAEAAAPSPSGCGVGVTGIRSIRPPPSCSTRPSACCSSKELRSPGMRCRFRMKQAALKQATLKQAARKQAALKQTEICRSPGPAAPNRAPWRPAPRQCLARSRRMRLGTPAPAQ